MIEEYYVVPVVGDDTVHTDEEPFCDDMTCPCHEDSDNITEVGDQVSDGLLTPDEANRYYYGRAI